MKRRGPDATERAALDAARAAEQRRELWRERKRRVWALIERDAS